MNSIIDDPAVQKWIDSEGATAAPIRKKLAIYLERNADRLNVAERHAFIKAMIDMAKYLALWDMDEIELWAGEFYRAADEIAANDFD